jgi:hypothetical protein
MFGLQEIIALNNGSARITPVTVEVSTGATTQRAAILSHDSEHGSQPDANAEQLRRQNSGGYCSGCGSLSGHYFFCNVITGR